MEVSTSCSLTNLEANTEKLQDKRFSRAEHVDLETFLETEVEPTDPFKPFGEDLQTNGEQIKVPEMALLEDEIPGEASAEKIEDSRFSHEECGDLEMFCGTGEEPADHVNLSPGDHQIDGEQIKVLELAQSESKNQHVIRETYDLSNLGTSMEKLRVEKFSHEECVNLDMFCGDEEEPPKLVRQFNQEHHNDAETTKFPSLLSSESEKCQVNTEEHALSVTLDGTPKSKFPDASGVIMFLILKNILCLRSLSTVPLVIHTFFYEFSIRKPKSLLLIQAAKDFPFYVLLVPFFPGKLK